MVVGFIVNLLLRFYCELVEYGYFCVVSFRYCAVADLFVLLCICCFVWLDFWVCFVRLMDLICCECAWLLHLVVVGFVVTFGCSMFTLVLRCSVLVFGFGVLGDLFWILIVLS